MHPSSLHGSYVKAPLNNSISKMPNVEDSLKFTKRLFIIETNNCLPLALDRSVAGSLWGGLPWVVLAQLRREARLATSALATSLLHTL